MLGIVAFFFLAGSELTLIAWLAAYLESDASLGQAQAMYGLTFMLVGFTGIRFAIGVFSIPIDKTYMVGALLLNIACCARLLSAGPSERFGPPWQAFCLQGSLSGGDY